MLQGIYLSTLNNRRVGPETHQLHPSLTQLNRRGRYSNKNLSLHLKCGVNVKAGCSKTLVPWPCLLSCSRVFLAFVILPVGTRGDLEHIWKWGQTRKRVNNSFFFHCLVSQCVADIKKSQQLGNGHIKQQFNVFSDSTLAFIKLDIYYW